MMASSNIDLLDQSAANDFAEVQKNDSLKLEAHRGEKLLAHCLQVGLYAQKLVREMRVRLPKGLSNEAFEKLAFLAGACHDFGKATNRFQFYLHSDDWHEKQRLKADRRTRHALLGAVVAHVLLSRSSLGEELKSTPLGQVLRFAPFWVIRRHHGSLLWVQKDLTPTREDFTCLSEQLDDCSAEEFNFILKQITARAELNLQSSVTLSQIKAELDEVRMEIGIDQQDLTRCFRQLSIDNLASLAPWLLLQQLFSVLLDADKSYAAVEIRRPVQDHGLNPDWVAQYRQQKFKPATSRVNTWRAEVSEVAAESIESALIDTAFFQLTLPTGLGKTLIALDCALRLRERLRAIGRSPRTVIYALPFLSILEQAAAVYDELFALALRCDEKHLPSELMIRHHHLAELRYVKGDDVASNSNSADDREFNPNQSQLMIEGWRSALVMTSTVQLFQSLFSGRNRTSRKLHRLAGAIVILDEVQSIPFKYWPLMNKAMRALSQLFDTRFILVTATQPRFLAMSGEADNTVELVPSYKTYFDGLNRTVTSFDLTPLSLESFANVIKAKMLEEHAGQDALIIVNTVAAAIKLFELLRSELSDSHDFVHLSTNIVPRERARRIELVKLRQNATRPLLVISTQLVEAGVDLSFPVLFRDFAPFSAIVQAAGRANRSGEYPSSGRVYLHKLMDEHGKIMARLIYDVIELTATDKVLKGMREKGFVELSESQLIAGVEKYFKVIQPLSTRDSQDVLEGAKALCFRKKSPREKEAIESFHLIEEEDTQEVFIEIDSLAADAWRAYNDVLDSSLASSHTLEESFDRAGRLRAARIRCLPFMLSVGRKHFADEKRAEERKDEICYYPEAAVKGVYKSETGWIRPER